MDVSYRRDKDHNYMVLDAPGNITGEEYQVRMIIGNQIPYILKCNKRMVDGKAVFFYEITGKQPMFRKFEKTLLNFEDITDLLQDIKKALENADRYLLDENQILFEPEYLFFDVQNRKWNLCYLPSYQGNITENFRILSEYILKKLDHSDEQAVRLGYEIYSKASEENYRISEILQMAYQSPAKQEKHVETTVAAEVREVTEKREEEKEEILEDPMDCVEYKTDVFPKKYEQSPKYEEEKQIPGHKTCKIKKNLFLSKGKTIAFVLGVFMSIAVIGILVWQRWLNGVQAGGILFLITGVLIYAATLKKEVCFLKFFKKKRKEEDFSEDMGTSVIREGEMAQMAMLVSLRPEEYVNILLYKEETRIGKEERQADICIAKDVISRIHARIQKEEGEYYVTDLDSTNGTYVNGRRIASTEEVRLQQGDRVSFANVEYIFQMSVNHI